MFHPHSRVHNRILNRRLTAMVFGTLIGAAGAAQAGPYSLGAADPTNAYDPPIAGMVGPLGEGKTGTGQSVNPVFKAWASTVIDYSPSPQSIQAQWTDSSKFLGPVTGDNFDIVSLGDLDATMIANGDDPGQITVGFDAPIWNGPGADFAVFENSFGSGAGVFAELANVEVSSNGTDFARFPSVDLTSGPVGAYGTIDPTNVYNLSGKHVNAYGNTWGTPFNLDDLTTHSLVLSGDLDLNAVTQIRLVDVPGDGTFKDSLGNSIYDAWVTWGSGGSDLDALGVINVFAPEILASTTTLAPFDSWDIAAGPSPVQIITLTNSGSGPLSFTGSAVEIIGDDAFDVFPRSSTLTSLAEGESLNLLVASNPDVVGPTSATLRILTDATTTPVLTIALQGEGLAPAAHDWKQFAGVPSNTGRQHVENPITSLEAPYWETGDEDLVTDGSIVVLPGSPDQVIAWGSNGAATSVLVKAFNADTGALTWTSPELSAGNTLSFTSWHTAAADAATSSVLMATGGNVYRLDGSDGSIVWSTPLNAGGSSEIVNGSVTIGGGRAYIATYGGFSPSAKRLYSINVADGTIAWSVQDGGPGSEAPVYVNNGMGEVVYTLLNGGIAAYDATDGTLIWNNSAPLSGSPWSTTHAFFGGVSYSDGVILAPTYSFGGTSELVAVDGWTGELLWSNTSTITGDSTPVAMNGVAYIVGHDFWGGPSYLAGYSLEDGSEVLKHELTSDSTMWNVSPVAYNDSIAVTMGENAFSPGADSGVRFLDPATGADLVLPTVDSESARGTPAIGRDGRLYVYRATGALAGYIPVDFEDALLVDLNGSMGTGQTDERTIEIAIDAPFATEMRIVEAPDNLGAAPWVPFQSTSIFELSSGSGIKTLDIQVRNGASESTVETFTIEYFEPSSVSDWMVLHD